jgi:hypothetical protein
MPCEKYFTPFSSAFIGYHIDYVVENRGESKVVERDNLLVISLLERNGCVVFLPVPVVPVIFWGYAKSYYPYIYYITN